MSTQFERRKAKSAAEVAKEIEAKKLETSEPVVYTQTGLDVYTEDGGKSYGVAEITYNPKTGEAKVIETFTITRLVALTYFNQKIALGTLKKTKDK